LGLRLSLASNKNERYIIIWTGLKQVVMVRNQQKAHCSIQLTSSVIMPLKERIFYLLTEGGIDSGRKIIRRVDI